ncbi:carbohydrate-binding protein [Mucilaginibacter gilvus]|uniref:Carbohydrate-binding protein n=1 Tax=Mucilaginibacter gilvus TaxID=2305909 RepID=A0A444MQP6_9SPHI|nr:carbohydrate-binding protein [Mucilaginibacter gilvus]RWY53941.1 carbohydrate-binding protein [Mucilaginibacter gilvus]
MKKIALICLAAACCAFIYNAADTGKPYQNKVQQLPGRLECEFYNEGGEGIAYHDTDSLNNGSGKLNPANGTFLNEFRMKEGVDISYTKPHPVDDNPYGMVAPVLGKLYVGWTKPGEWLNYTIKVTKPGKYPIGLMYTSNGDGLISLDIDGKDATGPLKVSTTHNDRDTVAWRQWHHWNKADAIGSISLTKGLHVLTIHIVAHGDMNLDYLAIGARKE